MKCSNLNKTVKLVQGELRKKILMSTGEERQSLIQMYNEFSSKSAEVAQRVTFPTEWTEEEISGFVDDAMVNEYRQVKDVLDELELKRDMIYARQIEDDIESVLKDIETQEKVVATTREKIFSKSYIQKKLGKVYNRWLEIDDRDINVLAIKDLNVSGNINEELMGEIESTIEMLKEIVAVNKVGLRREDEEPGIQVVMNGKEIDMNAAVAIVASGISYLNENYGNIVRMKEDDEIAEYYGLKRADIESMDKETYAELSDGLPFRFEVDNMGKEVMRMMGLKVKGTRIQEAKMYSSVGLYVYAKMERDGILKVVDVPVKKDEKRRVLKIANELNMDVYKQIQPMLDEMSIETEKMKDYSTKPYGVTKKSVRRMPYTDVSMKKQKVINELRNAEWKVSSSVQKMKEMIPHGQMLEILGYRDLELMVKNGALKDEIDEAKGQNEAIQREVDAIYTIPDNVDTVYFDYFVTKGQRIAIDSVGLNPMDKKELHRWLVPMKRATGIVRPDDEVFLYGIAQAFDYSVDKERREDVLKFANEMVQRDPDELWQGVIDGSLKYDHIGHAIAAIENIRRMQEANGGEFESDLLLELDGITNGMAIKLFQMPGKAAKEGNLTRVGVLPNEIDGGATMGDVMKETEGFTDIYETTVKKAIPNMTGDKLSDEQRVFKELMDKAGMLVSSFVKEDGSVSKEARALAKPPTMVFSYSAMRAGIVRKLNEEMMMGGSNKNIRKMIENPEIMEYLSETIGKDVDEIVSDLRKYSITHKNYRLVYNKLAGIYQLLYSDPIYEALESEFKEYMVMNEAVINAFKTTTEVFKKYLESKAGEQGKRLADMTSDEYVQLVRENLDKAPAINTAGGTSVLERLLIANNTVVSERNMNDDTTTGRDASTGRYNYRVAPVMREIGDAGRAGAVIPTHAFENDVMIAALEGGLFNSVNDAVVVGKNGIEDVKRWNEAFYEMNRDYDMLGEIVEMMDRTLILAKENRIDVDNESYEKYQILKELRDTYNNSKEVLYKDELRISQMNGPIGSEFRGKKERKSVDDRVDDVIVSFAKRSMLQKKIDEKSGVALGKIWTDTVGRYRNGLGVALLVSRLNDGKYREEAKRLYDEVKKQEKIGSEYTKRKYDTMVQIEQEIMNTTDVKRIEQLVNDWNCK